MRQTVPRRLLFVPILTLLTCSPALAQSSPSLKRQRMGLAIPTQKWVEDFDGMVKRRMIRILVVYSKTLFFVGRGVQRGIAYDTMKTLEDEVNQKLEIKHLRVNVLFIPVSREELLPVLVEGCGDVVVANLAITHERAKLVDFTDPVFTGVSEIVLTGPNSPTITSLDDLAGQGGVRAAVEQLPGQSRAPQRAFQAGEEARNRSQARSGESRG